MFVCYICGTHRLQGAAWLFRGVIRLGENLIPVRIKEGTRGGWWRHSFGGDCDLILEAGRVVCILLLTRPSPGVWGLKRCCCAAWRQQQVRYACLHVTCKKRGRGCNRNSRGEQASEQLVFDSPSRQAGVWVGLEMRCKGIEDMEEDPGMVMKG